MNNTGQGIVKVTTDYFSWDKVPYLCKTKSENRQKSIQTQFEDNWSEIVDLVCQMFTPDNTMS
jgi:hypothetical protein